MSPYLPETVRETKTAEARHPANEEWRVSMQFRVNNQLQQARVLRRAAAREMVYVQRRQDQMICLDYNRYMENLSIRFSRAMKKEQMAKLKRCTSNVFHLVHIPPTESTINNVTKVRKVSTNLKVALCARVLNCLPTIDTEDSDELDEEDKCESNCKEEIIEIMD